MHRSLKWGWLLALSLCCTQTFSQQYLLQKSFAECGQSFLPGENEFVQLKTMQVLPNGKILSAGNLLSSAGDSSGVLLIQYLPSGKIDTAGFGINGMVKIAFQRRATLANVLRLADGRILVVGFENNVPGSTDIIPAVYGFTPTGQVDSAFSNDGILALRFDDLSSGTFLNGALLSDGSIVAAGLSSTTSSGGIAGIGVMKLKTGGSLDSTFGNLANHPGRTIVAQNAVGAVHVFEQGTSLVLPFLRTIAAGDSRIHVAKLTANGFVDNSFGAGGIANTGIRSENLVATKQNDGRFLMGGTLNDPGSPKKIQVLRLKEDLTPDESFGTNGKVVFETSGPANSDYGLYDLQLLKDGKILLLGYFNPPGGGYQVPLIIRLKPDGKPDSSFNGTGSMTSLVHEPNTNNNGWNNIDTTTDGGFVIGKAVDFTLAKYLPDTAKQDGLSTNDFSFMTEGRKVYFTNRSTSADSYSWDFGDGATSEQVNPLHEYALPGSYVVSLELNDRCGTVVSTKTVNIAGISKITPDEGPNNGFVRARVYGFGFSNASKVILKATSLPALPADSVFFDAVSQTLQVNFRFKNAAPGMYDLIVTSGNSPNTKSDTLPQAFEIRNREIGEPWVQLNNTRRRGFVAFNKTVNFRVDYGVRGNATQYLVPLAFVLTGKGLHPQIKTTLLNRADTSHLPDSLRPHSNGFYQLYDEVAGDSVWVLYLVDKVVHPNEVKSIDFSVFIASTSKFRARAYIGHTLFDPRQADTLYGQYRTTNLCQNSCIKCLLDLAGYAPGPVGCAAGALSLACSINNYVNLPAVTGSDILNLGLDFVSTAVGCGNPAGGTVGKLLDEIGESLFGLALKQKGNYGLGQDCSQAMAGLSDPDCNPPGDDDGGEYDPLYSFDPNTKEGPGVSNPSHYINKTEPLPYTIYFENLPSATAAALEVAITDTLDKAVMNLASFRFGGFSISGVDYPVFANKDSFTTDIPLTAGNAVVRVSGKLDTTAGIVHWKFLSLDPVTMDLLEDPTQGFLPPNTDGVKGTGAVWFSVDQKETNDHLTLIANRASIVFDANAPILTPTWVNTVDTIKPQSQVSDLFKTLSDSTFLVKWSGSDQHAGIRHYKIAISENNGPYVVLASFNRDSTVVKGNRGSTYKFISIAKDFADNEEEPPGDALNNPDAVFYFSSALPVDFLSFTATRDNGTTKLTWAVAQEAGTSHFIIEHSINGIGFVTIGNLQAAVNSVGVTDYLFYHVQPLNGNNYYRIAVVDRDGSIRYSPVRMVPFEKPALLVVRPNPAADRVNVRVTEPGGIIRLIAGTGKIVREQKMNGMEVNIDLAGITPGLYFVSYTTNKNNVVQEKLIVQR